MTEWRGRDANISYAWDRELVRLARRGLLEPTLASILGIAAREFSGRAATLLRVRPRCRDPIDIT